MLASRLTLGSRLIFVGGKGGVGKTTVAAALAIELADAGERPTIISVDPAHSLGDALEVDLGNQLAPIPHLPGVAAAEVDAASEQERFTSLHGSLIRELLERGTYLASADVREITAGTIPGVDEIAALLAIRRILDAAPGRVIIDTAPTGHTVRLLELPELALTWISALEAMDEKHIAIASAIAGVYQPDAVTDFLARLRAEIAGIAALLRDPDATRFLLVTTVEPVVLEETYRFQDRLEEMGIALAGIVVNRSDAPDSGGEGVISLPRLPHSPRGIEGLRTLLLSEARRATAAPSKDGWVPALGAEFQLPSDRRLYFVVGKGGVGKTTAAASVALTLAARASIRVLLLSVDPAGSLGDVLGQRISSEPTAVEGAIGLWARQLDPEAAWSRFREDYRDDVETVLTGAILAGGETSLDRTLLQRLMDLSPAGLDELVGLLEVIDVNEDRVYDAVVVDTAPTGHLLRLLEMPRVALEWTHSVLRLLLKYRDVVHLSGTGERVLELAKSLRGIQALLRDRASTYYLVATLPDPLSVAETARLLPRLEELGGGVGALLVNRLFEGSGKFVEGSAEHVHRLALLDPELQVVGGPLLQIGPTGADDLLDFMKAWRVIQPIPADAEW